MRNRWRRKGGRQGREEKTIVLGVVYPPGAGGSQSPSESEWTLRFELKPWRKADGEIEERGLSVSKVVSQARLKEYMGLIQPFDVVRAQVQLGGELTATLIELIGKEADEELTRRAAELQEPVTIEVDFFGTLTLDRRVDWWETEQVWAGTPVTLSITLAEDGNVASVAKTAEALWRNQAEWDQQVRARAIDKLLVLKNENWRDEDEAEVTAAEFNRRMKLESVTVDPDGGFEFWFEDGDLFLGHSIRVWGNLTDGPTDADIAG
jgi:hypothetical protein